MLADIQPRDTGTAIIAGLLLVVIWLSIKILKQTKNTFPLPASDEEFPIEYPECNMFEMYDQIQTAIFNCTTEHDIKIAYVDIMIFQGSFSDSDTFKNELLRMCAAKEKEISTLG